MHTHVPISPPSWVSLPSSLYHPSRSSQSMEPISLCRASASHQPTILHSVVCICWCYSHFTPASPSHPMSSSPFSVFLFIPALQLGSSVPFFFSLRFHIYVLAYSIYFSLSDLLHSVWQTTLRMGENTCKWNNRQRINLQNIQTYHLNTY